MSVNTVPEVEEIAAVPEHPTRNRLLAGILLGILFNPVTGPATRKKLADAVFGSDDFTYESPAGDGSGGNSTAA